MAFGRNLPVPEDQEVVDKCVEAKETFEKAMSLAYAMDIDVTWVGLELDTIKKTKKLTGFTIRKILA